MSGNAISCESVLSGAGAMVARIRRKPCPELAGQFRRSCDSSAANGDPSEETFQIGKGQIGLDHYQCRTWTAWHRFTVLAMAALAVLVAITAAQPPPAAGLAPLTVSETRRLLTALTSARTDPRATIWSLWRRRHIAAAQTSHYKRHMTIESEHVNQRT